MAKIFSDTDMVVDICNEVLANGVLGISGGRLSVREKMKEVRDYAIQNGHDNINAQSTYNHSATELGYIFDENKYEKEIALKEVIDSY